MSKFRDFLYIDEPTVDRLLSGVEGGTFDSVDQRRSESQEPDSAEQRLGQQNVTTSEQRVMRQTAEARFSRLWNAVIGDADEEVFDNTKDDGDVWSTATEGKFCKLTGKLRVPSIVAAVSAAEELRNFLQLGQRLGFIPIGGNEDEMLKQMSALKDLIKETFPVVLNVGNGAPQVAMPLDTENSRVKVDRYIGTATVFGRIVEGTPAGEKHELLQIPGTAHLTQMSRQQRRAAERENKPTQENDMVLDGPVLTLRAIAIYQ